VVSAEADLRVSEREVSFYSNTHKLAAVLHLPEPLPSSPVPGVVVAGGFAGVKELRVPVICDDLAAGGYAALRFDYQGFGESEGARWRLLPTDQVQNIRDAVRFLSITEPIDGNRIAFYGNGWGGAPGLVAAASDQTVKCVACTATPLDGERWMRSLRPQWEWLAFQDRLEKDWRRRVLSGASESVPSDEIMIPDPRTHSEHQGSDKKINWRARLPLETAQAVVDFRPERDVARLAPRPLLIIHCELDALIPVDEAHRAFALAGEPKRLRVLEGAAHHDIYYSPWKELAMEETLRWFGEHLS
jgi:uncharacterized protein